MNIPTAADELDLKLFNAANRLYRLGEETGDAELFAASRVVGAARAIVRKHMAKADIDATTHDPKED